MKKAVIFLFCTTCALSCTDIPNSNKYETGSFPEYPVNLTGINSGFDDYNSDIQIIDYKYLFHFSSNRNSQGIDFDIIGENLSITWSKVNGTLNIGTDPTIDWFISFKFMFDSINTSSNELGPYSLCYRNDNNASDIYWIDLLMYSSDIEGNFNIYFICTETENGDGNSKRIKPSQRIEFINNDANELYPSFYGNDFYFYDEWGTYPSKITKMLYCSDMSGNYDIYEINLGTGTDFIAKLTINEKFEPEKLDVSSDYNDKCPYVNGELLVFASDRPGGCGGFDLYYSTYENEKWTTPVNFGEKINTEYDEYRPVTLLIHGFENNLMIFSSNRSGSMGGFDLYYVGIKQMIE